MILGVPKEILDNELRVAALPETVAEYVKMGFEVLVQSSAGAGALRSDAEYEASGAKQVYLPVSGSGADSITDWMNCPPAASDRAIMSS